MRRRVSSAAHGSVYDVAVTLRLDHDLSIRAIAARLSIPRGTVGGWLQGVGEARYHQDCKLCGSTFVASRSHKVFCDKGCARKHLTIFGAVR